MEVDGTSTIGVLDVDSLAQTRHFTVHDGNAPIEQLNELEFVEGEIFANVWQTDRIARISPQSSRVVGWIDASRASEPNLSFGIWRRVERNRLRSRSQTPLCHWQVVAEYLRKFASFLSISNKIIAQPPGPEPSSCNVDLVGARHSPSDLVIGNSQAGAVPLFKRVASSEELRAFGANHLALNVIRRFRYLSKELPQTHAPYA